MSHIVDAPTDAEKRLYRRRDRFVAQRVNWVISQHSRTRACGRVGVLADGGAAVRVTTHADGRATAGFAGLATCGSVWACPVCAERIMAGRQADMTSALDEWTARGGRVGFITLTMRHRRGQALVDLWDAMTAAWHAVTSGRGWLRDQVDHGVLTSRVVRQGHRKGQTVVEPRIGWMRTTEVTHGENGWHVHVHVAVLLSGDVTASQVDDLACSMFQRWRDALVAAGLDAPLARHGGLDARLWDGSADVMSVYFTKATYRSTAELAALELTRSDLKRGRKTSRTPFQILAAIADEYLASDGDLWAEFERAAHGRRQVAWSMGLRADLLGSDSVEKTDEELAEETLDGVPLIALTRTGVATMTAGGHKASVLEAAEQGYAALQAVLLHLGVEFCPATPDTLRDTRRSIKGRQLERTWAA